LALPNSKESKRHDSCGPVKQYAVVISATLVLVATWIGLQFVAPRSHSLVWLLVPAWAGAFWWIDGYRIRDVATWVIPLTVVMAAAQLVPATAAIASMGVAAATCSLLLAFTSSARRIWARVIGRSGLDRRAKDVSDLIDIGDAVQRAFRDYARDSTHERVYRRAHQLLDRARRLEAEEPHTRAVQALPVDYLATLTNVTRTPWIEPPQEHADLVPSWERFRTSLDQRIPTYR
jgi:hypothetical protein